MARLALKRQDRLSASSSLDVRKSFDGHALLQGDAHRLCAFWSEVGASDPLLGLRFSQLLSWSQLPTGLCLLEETVNEGGSLPLASARIKSTKAGSPFDRKLHTSLTCARDRNIESVAGAQKPHAPAAAMPRPQMNKECCKQRGVYVYPTS